MNCQMLEISWDVGSVFGFKHPNWPAWQPLGHSGDWVQGSRVRIVQKLGGKRHSPVVSLPENSSLKEAGLWFMQRSMGLQVTMLNGAQKASEGYARRDRIAGKTPQKPNRNQHCEKSWSFCPHSAFWLTSEKTNHNIKSEKIQNWKRAEFFLRNLQLY